MSGIIKKLGEKIKLIEGSDEVRAQKCLEAVKSICGQYDCMLVPTITTQGNDAIGFRMHGDVGIIPIPREPQDDKKSIIEKP